MPLDGVALIFRQVCFTSHLRPLMPTRFPCGHVGTRCVCRIDWKVLETDALANQLRASSKPADTRPGLADRASRPLAGTPWRRASRAPLSRWHLNLGVRDQGLSESGVLWRGGRRPQRWRGFASAHATACFHAISHRLASFWSDVGPLPWVDRRPDSSSFLVRDGLRDRMARTPATRGDYERPNGSYASDVTDREWPLIAPLFPGARPGGRPRSTCLQRVVDEVLLPAAGGLPLTDAAARLPSAQHGLRVLLDRSGRLGPCSRRSLSPDPETRGSRRQSSAVALRRRIRSFRGRPHRFSRSGCR